MGGCKEICEVLRYLRTYKLVSRYQAALDPLAHHMQRLAAFNTPPPAEIKITSRGPKIANRAWKRFNLRLLDPPIKFLKISFLILAL